MTSRWVSRPAQQLVIELSEVNHGTRTPLSLVRL
jgi:hypothetical protein